MPATMPPLTWFELFPPRGQVQRFVVHLRTQVSPFTLTPCTFTVTVTSAGGTPDWRCNIYEQQPQSERHTVRSMAQVQLTFTISNLNVVTVLGAPVPHGTSLVGPIHSDSLTLAMTILIQTLRQPLTLYIRLLHKLMSHLISTRLPKARR